MENTNKPNVRDLRNGNWLWINKLVLEHPYLTNSAKLVYAALAYFADNKNQQAFPNYETIMRLTGLKRRVITNAVKQLEGYYFIEVQREKGKVNQYVLLKLTDSKPVHKMRLSKEKGWFIPGIGPVQNKHWGSAK